LDKRKGYPFADRQAALRIVAECTAASAEQQSRETRKRARAVTRKVRAKRKDTL
jgi:hypothetical protein